MNGILVSAYRAHAAHMNGFKTFIDPNRGYWVETDGVTPETIRYRLYKTGDVVQEIPEDALPLLTSDYEEE